MNRREVRRQSKTVAGSQLAQRTLTGPSSLSERAMQVRKYIPEFGHGLRHVRNATSRRVGDMEGVIADTGALCRVLDVSEALFHTPTARRHVQPSPRSSSAPHFVDSVASSANKVENWRNELGLEPAVQNCLDVPSGQTQHTRHSTVITAMLCLPAVITCICIRGKGTVSRSSRNKCKYCVKTFETISGASTSYKMYPCVDCCVAYLNRKALTAHNKICTIKLECSQQTHGLLKIEESLKIEKLVKIDGKICMDWGDLMKTVCVLEIERERERDMSGGTFLQQEGELLTSLPSSFELAGRLRSSVHGKSGGEWGLGVVRASERADKGEGYAGQQSPCITCQNSGLQASSQLPTLVAQSSSKHQTGRISAAPDTLPLSSFTITAQSLARHRPRRAFAALLTLSTFSLSFIRAHRGPHFEESASTLYPNVPCAYLAPRTNQSQQTSQGKLGVSPQPTLATMTSNKSFLWSLAPGADCKEQNAARRRDSAPSASSTTSTFLWRTASSTGVPAVAATPSGNLRPLRRAVRHPEFDVDYRHLSHIDKSSTCKSRRSRLRHVDLGMLIDMLTSTCRPRSQILTAQVAAHKREINTYLLFGRWKSQHLLKMPTMRSLARHHTPDNSVFYLMDGTYQDILKKGEKGRPCGRKGERAFAEGGEAGPENELPCYVQGYCNPEPAKWPNKGYSRKPGKASGQEGTTGGDYKGESRHAAVISLMRCVLATFGLLAFLRLSERMFWFDELVSPSVTLGLRGTFQTRKPRLFKRDVPRFELTVSES
ncbi:hypothetical protein PR048_001827 [Dryococelus australis]|uniref:Uncharacterized protein n=1 Tax=Dryococelus australis TaxID=614101 RepID=A0ABQ9IKY7_9NEOP|nr:hypothetical protein PR048_001827 [Dryococelus australis]